MHQRLCRHRVIVTQHKIQCKSIPSLVVYAAKVKNLKSLNNRMEFCVMHSIYYGVSMACLALRNYYVLLLKADFHEANCAADSPRNVTKHAQFE